MRWQPPNSALLQGFEAVLPAAHLLVGRQAVLDEVERPAGLEHPPHLAQRRADVGDGAQGPRRHGAVAAVVVERQGLAVEAGSLGPGRCVAARRLAASFQPRSAGSIGGDLGHGGRVEGDVEAGPEAELDDVAVEPFAHPAPQRIRGLEAAGHVDDPGQHMVGVGSRSDLRVLLPAQPAVRRNCNHQARGGRAGTPRTTSPTGLVGAEAPHVALVVAGPRSLAEP